MYKFLKPLLFRLDPEKAHGMTMSLFMKLQALPGSTALLKSLFHCDHPNLHKSIAGLNFKNPVGLAAGFDKDGKYMHAMAALGFSHLEIGTVTPRSQSGNPKSRLFRLVKSRGLINRMGFNNDGAEALAKRLRKGKPDGVIIGANIGKNKDTPNDEATLDYLKCFITLYDLVDYFTVNVSSPNTPGLRSLQDKEPLTNLLAALQKENKNHKPVFLKIAPDLTQTQLDEIIGIVINTSLTGIIATNTTISRDGLEESKEEIETIGAGGLSGAPLLDKAVGVIKYLADHSGKKFIIIGVGGIEDDTSAKKHFDAGADLIQLYTGLIYTGPMVVKNILRKLI